MMGIRIFHKISANMLMGFGSHFGSLFSSEWQSDSTPFIHSRFQSRFLIDLAFTSSMTSRALKFISFFVSRRLRFLYFLGEGFSKFLYKVRGSERFWKYNFFLISRWIPGTLTNYKLVRIKLLRFRDCNNLLFYPSGFIFLGESKFLSLSSSEARGSKIPSIGLADIDSGFSPFSYTIPSNNKSFSVSLAYYRLFRCATEHGWALGNAVYRASAISPLKVFIHRFAYFCRVKIWSLVSRIQIHPRRRIKNMFQFFRRRPRRFGRYRRNPFKPSKWFSYLVSDNKMSHWRFSKLYFDLFLRVRVIRYPWVVKKVEEKMRKLRLRTLRRKKPWRFTWKKRFMKKRRIKNKFWKSNLKNYFNRSPRYQIIK